MTASPADQSDGGVNLRQAALVAGFAYLLNPVSYAEAVYPRLIATGDIEQTVRNISAHRGMFVLVAFCYLVSFIGDVVIAWALYILFIPVNRSLSLLAAWFQIVYASMAFSGTTNLFTVYRMVTNPEYLTVFQPGPMHAQIDLLLHSFRYQWAISLIIFGIHLILAGALILRSVHVPRFLGVLLIIDGLGWIIDSTSPYILPDTDLSYISITFFGELVFMLWLLIRGWKVPRALPAPHGAA